MKEVKMVKINWQKKAKELETKNLDLNDRLDGAWEEGEERGVILFSLVLGAILILIILLFSGAFNSPFSELDIDEQFLARAHILNYYPEFGNCSITYSGCGCGGGFLEDCIPAVKVYCKEELSDRDNLRVRRKDNPTEIICFEGITIEDIFLKRINYMRK